MVETYRSVRDENGQVINGRVQLFIYDIHEDGEIGGLLKGLNGTSIVPQCAGTLLVVDEYVAKQADKLKFIDGTLVVKEGETIEEPVKSDAELQEEELLRQLAELRAQKSAPAE